MSARKLFIVLTLLCALLSATRPLACAETPTLTPGELLTVDLTPGARIFTLTLPAEGDYALYAFPAEGYQTVTAKLTQGDTLIAEGADGVALLTAALLPDTPYTLALTGTGRVYLELSRRALSRCFDEPKALDAAGDTYAKALVRPGDAHWYALTADERRPIILTGLPEAPGLRLEARLFNPSGRLLAEATTTAGGAFLMDFLPRPGRAYRVRVSASGRGTGLYALNIAPGAGGLPEALLLSDDRVTLRGRQTHTLEATPIPTGAADALLWESSDDTVVSVTQDGVLTGRRPGTAVVTAYAPGAVRARCRVEITRVQATGLRLITRRVRMSVGDDVALEWSVQPENASDPRVTFAIEPEGVATIDDAGVLRAVGEGTVTFTVRAADGGYEAVGRVYVAPARKRYRALLVGEQSYSPDVAAARPGSANSVSGMRSMLNELSFRGARYEISTALDVSRDSLLEAVARAFDGATDQDESLFYLTCHGDYAQGMTVFTLYDGSTLTAPELRQALDRIPGNITLLLDCCGSGGAIGAEADLLDGITRAFSGVAGPARFGSSRYRVLASAMVGQDSYRLSFDSTAQETRMATLFARAVCEGCGWSIDAAARRAMRADINYDNIVTLDELYHYARRRVMWYLSLAHSARAQTVMVSPEGSTRSLFERTTALE